ncbi:hypothetical protein GHT06_006597 [Daphnia sinensis]|uniref:Uncharacterized protein n=1 Tax=Daphnia sinensis TaxID=1820382 RepID=A0AAD5KFH3_9CRUS|nr:hypothetical protein GHT06_004456 [Daphnia sinensis]KAI9549872.1 hypothetical protein GHT06_007258 [Daphnia sinensis]KAI9550789.1 hypothetical protein GHT06_006597 [Daphnia sinensis]
MGKKRRSDKESLNFPENVLPPLEPESCYTQQLDDLISKMYTFVDVINEDLERKPIIEPPNEIDHTILLHFHSLPEKNEDERSNIKRRILKRKSKFCENISYEDMCSVVVTGEWILKKQGIYGKGRERRGEEITGAVHSPLFKSLLNKNN